MSTIVYNMDCMDYMKTLPDNAFDLAVVDPPYGIKMSMKAAVGGGARRGHSRWVSGNYTYKDWDAKRPDRQYFDELRRVSCNQIIWGGNYFADLLPVSRAWIFWDKNTTGNYADGELAWTSFDKGIKQCTYQWNGFMQGNAKNREVRIHPTQKPVALYEWILTNYAHKGERILDTHVGSGSSRIAAAELGFDYVGCELDKDYFDAEEARFTRYMAQLKLFETTKEKQGELIEA